MNNPNNPEVVGYAELIDSDGNTNYRGGKILGLQIRQSKTEPDGVLDLDVRGYDKKNGLILRISLPEFTRALMSATLNADRDI